MKRTPDEWHQIFRDNEPEAWASMPSVVRENLRSKAWSLFRQAKIDKGEWG